MAKSERARKLSSEAAQALDTEIRFLEGLTRRDAGWVDVLKLLGDDYTRRGRIDEGLQVDERLAGLCPEDALVFYNLACSCSLSERYEQAFAALDRAVKLGYDDFKWLNKDPDMANLRKHPLFKAFQGSSGPRKH
jgi:tetratricopeptide (TPR) repeat protein